MVQQSVTQRPRLEGPRNSHHDLWYFCQVLYCFACHSWKHLTPLVVKWSWFQELISQLVTDISPGIPFSDPAWACVIISGTQYRRTINHEQVLQSDPDIPGPDLPEPRFTGRIYFPQYRKLTIFDPDIPGTPIYRAKPFPPSIPVNRGSTVYRDGEW